MRGSSTRIRGRSRLVATVAALGDTAGPSRLALVGEAGVGKSRIVEEALRDRPHARGNGVPSMSWSPYFAVQTALRSEITGEPDEAAEQVLRLIGDRVLWIDDVHWASTATVMALDLLDGRVPLVVTAREHELSGIHHEFVRSSTHLTVRPLDARSARQVATDHWPNLSGARLDDLVEMSAGNPLLLTSLPGADGSVAVDLTDAVAQMLHRAPAAERDALGRLAVIGRPFPAAALALEVPEGRIDPASAASRILHFGPDGVWFRHPAFPEFVLGSLAREVPRYHADVGDLVGPEDRAVHLLGAGRVDQAYELANELAACASTAIERARHLEVAIGAAERLGRDVDPLRVDAVECLVAAQRFDDALAMAATITADDPAQRAAAGFHEARARWFRGEVDLAEAALAQAIVHAERVDSPMRPRIRAERAYLMLRHGIPGGQKEAEKAVAEAVATGNGGLRARAVLAVADGYRLHPGWDEELRRAAAAARRAGDVEMELTTLFSLGSGLGLIGRLRDGNAIHVDSAARAHRYGRTTWLSHIETARLMNLAVMAERQAEIADRSDWILRNRPRFRNWAQLYTAGVLALGDLGRISEALALAAEGRELAESDEERTWIAVATSHIAWTTRDGELLDTALDLARGAGDAFRGLRMVAELDAVHFALEHSRTGTYGSLPEPQVPATLLPNQWTSLIEVEAFAALRAGDLRRAATLFGEAADSWRCSDQIRYEIRARWAQAETLAAAGRRGAPTVRTAALDLARRHGLAGQLQRWNQPAVAGIAPREMEALRHVGRGLTSTEIAAVMELTPTTVDSYIASARRKLGVRTRAEAALRVAPHGARP